MIEIPSIYRKIEKPSLGIAYGRKHQHESRRKTPAGKIISGRGIWGRSKALCYQQRIHCIDQTGQMIRSSSFPSSLRKCLLISYRPHQYFLTITPYHHTCLPRCLPNASKNTDAALPLPSLIVGRFHRLQLTFRILAWLKSMRIPA